MVRRPSNLRRARTSFNDFSAIVCERQVGAGGAKLERKLDDVVPARRDADNGLPSLVEAD